MSGAPRVRFVMDHLNHDDLIDEPLLPEAPVDGSVYGRGNEAWQRVLGLAGGTLTGQLTAASFAQTALGGGYQLDGGGWLYGRPGGGLVLRSTLGNVQPQIENNNGGGARDIVDTVNGDARYLVRETGGQLLGPLITAGGSSVTNPGLGIGDNATGFYRAGNFLLLSVGGEIHMQWLSAETMLTHRLNMAGQQIQSLGSPTAATHAANRSYVDGAAAMAKRGNLQIFYPYEATLLPSPALLLDANYLVDSNEPRTIVVTVHPAFAEGSNGTFYEVTYTCVFVAPGVEEHVLVYRTNTAYLRSSARFAGVVTPVSNSVRIQLTARIEGIAPPVNLVHVGTTSGTPRSNLRSYVVVEEAVN